MTTEELPRPALRRDADRQQGRRLLELTNAGLAQGLGPETLLYEGAGFPSLEEVGARFEARRLLRPRDAHRGQGGWPARLEILRPPAGRDGGPDDRPKDS